MMNTNAHTLDSLRIYPDPSSRFAPRWNTPNGGAGGGGGGDNKTGGNGQAVDWTALPDEAKGVIATLVKAGVEAQVKPIAESLAAITERLDALPAAKDDAPKDKGSKGGDGGDDQSEIATLLAKTNERLDALEQEKQTAQQRETALRLAQAAVEKHHPNAKGKETLIKRIAAANPTSEEEADAARTGLIEELTALGVNTESFGASPENEGAKKDNDPDNESEDEFTERRKKEISERKKTNPLGV